MRSLVLSIILSTIISYRLNSQINFSTQSQYKYLKGSQAASLPANWMAPGYSDASWSTGNAPFRYGDGTGGTELTDMQNNYSTIYLRSSFDAFNIENITQATFYVVYDDGFVIWINGEEVVSRLAPAVYSYNAFSTGLHEYDAPETILVSGNDLNLQEGENIIAVQIFNTSLESSDIYFDLSINAVPSTPILNDTIGITFSHPSGFYSSNFTLSLTSPDPSATLRYTLDGSNPQTSATAFTAGVSTTVSINPTSTTGRGTTPAVVVRASITKTGYLPSYPSSRTFIYLNRVRTQSYPGYDWPNYNVNDQMIDYDMDPDVVNDSRYSSLIDDALLDIPTISIITDNKNLFDPATGIYVNAMGHGMEWERECNVALIYPDGSPGFDVNAGLRIRGGWSRHNNFPKHAFRLFFRSEYGDSKLRFPLFGDEGVSQFDKMDLRCEQNYAWSNGYNNNTMVREIFSRDLQRDMDRPYTRSDYYQLYINGMYWGIFQTQERSEARFASDYFGDKADDYDVIKVNTDGYRVEATDGTITSWQRIYSLTNAGFVDNAKYFYLEGKNASGKPVQGGEVLVDIDNLIDYMITIFYTGNFDAPTSSFGNNKGPNNFYAIENRNDKSKGYIFFNHDAEHSLFVDQVWPGIGLTENRVNIGDRTDDYKMTVGDLYSFHPQWLHYKLSANEEYRIRFADRAVLWLANNGALTPTKAWSRFKERVDEIDIAVIAESARWGDAQSGSPYTKDDHWLPQIYQMENSFFPVRTNLVINQLRQAGLYPALINPEFVKNGIISYDQAVKITSPVQMVINNKNTTGSIYYTLNDTDPRLVGGGISGVAIEAGDQAILNISASANIKARIYDNGEWSPIREIKIFSQNDDLSNLKVTEIHYHPQDIIVGTDTTEGGDLEFMEFKNIGTTSLNLSGIVIDSAITFTFPANTILGPGQFYVIASKPNTFYNRYGMIASGNYSGNLANSGEEVLIKKANGSTLIHFTYDDHDPWPEEPDGNGPSLVSRDFNPTQDPEIPYYWRSSLRIGGSPFEDDTPPLAIEDPFVTGSDHPDLIIYPNPTSGILNINLHEETITGLVNVRIYTLEGELIYHSDINSDITIDLNQIGLRAGIYLLQLNTPNSSEIKKVLYTP